MSERLSAMFDVSVFPKKKFYSHDARCVTYVNKLNEDQRYVYRMSKPVVIRYSELYLNFVAGNIEKDTKITAKNFEKDLEIFKNELIKKNEATEFFATERVNGNLESIFCNVFQSFGGVDVYKTLEEKASNLLYFMIKNHPFVDGNKRSGAYSFIWFLKNNNILNINKINPQTLTILTILIAESNQKDKEKMIGLILQILK